MKENEELYLKSMAERLELEGKIQAASIIFTVMGVLKNERLTPSFSDVCYAFNKEILRLVEDHKVANN